MLMAGSARVIDGSTRIVTALPLQRTARMKRFWLLALLAVGGVAHADSGTLPNGAVLAWNRTFLHENNSKTAQLPQKDPDSFWATFNLAHCVCSQFNYGTNIQNPDFHENTFAPELKLTPGSPTPHLPMEIWTGTECDQDLVRDQKCHHVTSADIADISSLASTGYLQQVEIPLFDLMEPATPRMGCEMIPLQATVWAITSSMQNGTRDYFLTKEYDVDMQPPPLPTAFKAEGAENAIQLSWTPSTGNVADVAYYQALCANDAGQPALTNPPAKRYMTPRLLCGAQQDALLTPSDVAETSSRVATPQQMDAAVDAPADAPDAGSDDGGVMDGGVGTITLPTGLSQLDPAFICGESATATSTSMRIQGLQNDVPYTVVFLAIDKYGNAAGTFFTSKLTPHAVTDFWEDLHDQGSHAEGGFCLIAETYGDDNPLTNLLRSFRDNTLGGSGFGRALTSAYYATLGKLGVYVHGHLALRIISGILLVPLVAFALLWHFVTLPGLALLVVLAMLMRRRALRMRLAQLSTAALVLLVAGRAHAQSPYWEDQTHTTNTDDEGLAEEPIDVNWHVGVRVGPYVPGIDDQLGMKNAAGKGPYQAMFGGYSIMPMLDVDRFLWKGLGQLGVGLSLGYMGKSAHAWEDGSSPSDPNRPRSPGDSNSFHLIPVVASAIYRFSYLDDEYGIPLVPYARAGLGYYVWWISAPSGDFAAVCKNGGMPPCTENKAAGATLGFVGSIGLSIRAERIDASAARSMHESGIEHAGFYGELSLGKVDGFGSDTKLSVGDTTWFAGVEFEF
jgi:hypothetical protein